MKRIFAVLLIAAMMLCSLASCGDTAAEKMIKDADKALLTTPYKLVMDVSMECDNEDYAEIFEEIGFDTDLYIDGDNFLMIMELFGAEFEYMCVGDTVYAVSSFMDQTAKVKCTLTDAQREEFLDSSSSSGADFSALDFKNISVTENDKGQTVVKCSDIKASVLDAYIDSELGSLDVEAEMSISGVTLEATFEDGKYQSIAISMTYEYTFGNESVVVDCKITTAFDYAAGRKLEVPSDAKSYENVDYDELMPGW